jgi:hypothetical protein
MGCDPSFSLVAERAVRVQAALSENDMAGENPAMTPQIT